MTSSADDLRELIERAQALADLIVDTAMRAVLAAGDDEIEAVVAPTRAVLTLLRDPAHRVTLLDAMDLDVTEVSFAEVSPGDNWWHEIAVGEDVDGLVVRPRGGSDG